MKKFFLSTHHPSVVCSTLVGASSLLLLLSTLDGKMPNDLRMKVSFFPHLEMKEIVVKMQIYLELGNLTIGKISII
jgi:hypothetical protein